MKVILIVLFVNLLIVISKGDAQNGGEKDARVFPLKEDESEQESDEFFEDPIANKIPPEENDHNKGRYESNHNNYNNKEKPVSGWSGSGSGTNYVEFKYKCAALNGKQCPIEKLLLKASFPMTSLDCNQRSCVGFITDYVAYDPEGRKSKMTVDYLDQTLYPTTFVYKNGAKTHYDIGTVTAGPCKGAIVQVTDYSPNPNPGACNTKKGVTSLDSSFAELSIIGCGKENIACFGAGYNTFTPGLNSNS